MNMHRIIIIIPYFGKLPNYFQLFLDSCKENKTIDFLLITDDRYQYQYPDNFKIMYKDFPVFAKEVQDKFDFAINLEKPYKLCDFKPTYGYILEEQIEDYTFWGHCDIDMIMGDIRKFATDEILNAYAKIYTFGHLTLYKNSYENNRVFMRKLSKEDLYRKVFSSSSPFIFDEGYNNSINNIYDQEGLAVFKEFHAADIEQKSNSIRMIEFNFIDNSETLDKHKDSKFFYDKGKIIKIYKENNSLVQREYAYIHLQKRPMSLEYYNSKYPCFCIGANKFVSILELPNSVDAFDKIKSKYRNNQYLKIRSRNLKVKIKRYISGIVRKKTLNG